MSVRAINMKTEREKRGKCKRKKKENRKKKGKRERNRKGEVKGKKIQNREKLRQKGHDMVQIMTYHERGEKFDFQITSQKSKFERLKTT
jgi:hypothetical protein